MGVKSRGGKRGGGERVRKRERKQGEKGKKGGMGTFFKRMESGERREGRKR